MVQCSTGNICYSMVQCGMVVMQYHYLMLIFIIVHYSVVRWLHINAVLGVVIIFIWFYLFGIKFAFFINIII